MKREVQTVVDASTSSEIWLPCIQCSGDTLHKPLVEVSTEGSLRDGDFDLFWNERHQTVQCQGCRSVSFRHESTNSEDVTHVGDGNFEPLVRVTLYPPREKDYPGLPDAHFLPTLIQVTYNETLSALRRNLPVLSAVGMRMIVEAVCREQNATGTLQQMIDTLVRMGVLRDNDANLLHRLRSMGNDAAHQVKPHSRDFLRQALAAIEHLLISVYLVQIRTALLSPATDDAPWGKTK